MKVGGVHEGGVHVGGVHVGGVHTFSQSMASEKTPMDMRTKASEKSSYQMNSSAGTASSALDAAGGAGMAVSGGENLQRHTKTAYRRGTMEKIIRELVKIVLSDQFPHRKQAGRRGASSAWPASPSCCAAQPREPAPAAAAFPWRERLDGSCSRENFTNRWLARL